MGVSVVVSGSGEVAAFEALAEEALGYAAASRSVRTQQAYAADWAHFEAWAGSCGLDPLPAEPATVVLYLTELARTYKPSTITRRMASISVAHQTKGLPTPTADPRVRAVTRGIRRTLGVAPKEAAPAVIGELRRMVAHLPASSMSGTRDRALLLVGFASALRRSELVALDVADLEQRDEGMVLRIHRSKTDQEGAGRPWDDATGSDVADFVGQLNDDQGRLVVSLAFAEHPHSASAHAGRLGVSVDDVAGYVGPVNKRAKKLGWASPVRSQRHFNGKTTDKVLVLDDRLASWVKNHYEEDNRT